MPLESNWTDERCTQLDELWAAGFSASLIADKMGGGITRCSVIGKAHRRGLARRAKSPGTLASIPAVMAIRRKYTARQVSVNGTHREMTTVRLEAAPVEIKDSEIPAAQRKTFLELKNHHCRWPVGEVGEPGFFFCGAPANYPFASYCAHHRKRSRGERKKFTGEHGGSYRLTIGKYA